jgi:hypothetical protein
MRYLYGDSSTSPLQENFIELLRDAIDLAVQLARAAERIEHGRESEQARAQAAEVELGRLEQLEGIVSRSLAGAPTGAADSPAARCASAIARSATDLVRGESEGVRARLTAERSRLDGEAGRERESCVRALEVLLKRHDLPTSATSFALRIEGGHYHAHLTSTTGFGVDSTIDLEVPASNLFFHPLRIERLLERLEVQAPEESGWLQKKIKVKPQRLERYYLAELSSGGGSTSIALRANQDGSGDGYRLTIDGDPARAELSRLGESGQLVGDPFQLLDTDTDKLVGLRDRLTAAATELQASRRGLTSARLDGTPLGELEDPMQLAERLIATIAPIVQEISLRSLAPNELVIKRLVGDDRREEIFVSKSELLHKIAQAPESKRALFEPLGLGEAPHDSVPPPPASSSGGRPITLPRGVPVVPDATPKAEYSAPGIPIEDDAIVEAVEGVVVAIEADAEPTPPPHPNR